MQEGMGDRAYGYYKSICPAAQPDQTKFKSEPYVYSQMIAGKAAPNHGEAKNAWLTGTAAWTLLTVMQGFAGIKPDYDGLVIDPCIPSGWPGFKVARKIRGTAYHIHVENPDGICKGIKDLSVNGKHVTGNRIPYVSNGETVEIVAIMGEA